MGYLPGSLEGRVIAFDGWRITIWPGLFIDEIGEKWRGRFEIDNESHEEWKPRPYPDRDRIVRLPDVQVFHDAHYEEGAKRARYPSITRVGKTRGPVRSTRRKLNETEAVKEFL